MRIDHVDGGAFVTWDEMPTKELALKLLEGFDSSAEERARSRWHIHDFRPAPVPSQSDDLAEEFADLHAIARVMKLSTLPRGFRLACVADNPRVRRMVEDTARFLGAGDGTGFAFRLFENGEDALAWAASPTP